MTTIEERLERIEARLDAWDTRWARLERVLWVGLSAVFGAQVAF